MIYYRYDFWNEMSLRSNARVKFKNFDAFASLLRCQNCSNFINSCPIYTSCIKNTKNQSKTKKSGNPVVNFYGYIGIINWLKISFRNSVKLKSDKIYVNKDF